MHQVTWWFYITASSQGSPGYLTNTQLNKNISSHTPQGNLFSRGLLRYLRLCSLVVSQAKNNPLIFIKYCDIHVTWRQGAHLWSVMRWVYLNGDCVELKLVDGVLRCRHRLHHLTLLLPELFLWTSQENWIQHGKKNHNHVLMLKICKILTDGK